MLPNQIISTVAYFASAITFAILTWLFTDALLLKVEIKTTLKAVGTGLLTTALTLNLVSLVSPTPLPQLIFWIQSIGLLLLFIAFILDPHTKLQFLIILALVFLYFFREHSLLAIQASLVATLVLHLAHVTKHNDLIPFGVGFVLIAVGEFFYSLQKQTAFGNLQTAGDFLYIFASIALFWWLWQYLVIRFNLARKIPKLI